MKDKKIKRLYRACWILGVIALFFLAYGIVTTIINQSAEGKYDYCIEWEGLGGGILHRDNLLYTCYSLSVQTFYCDYEINTQTQVLMIRPIINVTKNDEGLITEINYDQAMFFNCTRWLKSRS